MVRLLLGLTMRIFIFLRMIGRGVVSHCLLLRCLENLVSELIGDLAYPSLLQLFVLVFIMEVMLELKRLLILQFSIWQAGPVSSALPTHLYGLFLRITGLFLDSR